MTAAEFLVAVEAEDRREAPPRSESAAGAHRQRHRAGVAARPVPGACRESQVEWNRAAERVESVSALMFDQIAIEETRRGPIPRPPARCWQRRPMEAGIARFVDREELEAFLERVRFAAQHGAGAA